MIRQASKLFFAMFLASIALLSIFIQVIASSPPAPQAAALPRVSSLASTNALTVALYNDIGGFDPALLLDSTTFKVTNQIYDTLFAYKGSDSFPVPSLVESWSVSADGRTWTFNLRPGVKFHDGTDLDADAVVYNFQRWWDPAHPAHNGSFDYFAGLFGGYKGDPNSQLVSVRAIGSLQVQIVLAQPNTTLPSILTNPAFAIASPAALQAGTLMTAPVGSGPFKFSGDWVSGDHIGLIANASYWNDRPKLDDLIFKVIVDDDSRLAALQANTVQIVDGLGSGYVVSATADSNLRVIWQPPSNTGYLGLNRGHTPLNNSQVRTAIAMAINKPALLSNHYAAGDQVATHFLPPGIWGRDPTLVDYDYDPVQAHNLLVQAGYPNGFTTTIAYRNVYRAYLRDPAGTANAIAADLQAIGITTTAVEYESSDFLNRVRNGQLDLFLLGWFADYPHPDNFFTPHFCPGYSSFGPVDTQLCDQLQAARAATDMADQLAIYQWADGRVRDSLPLISLVHAGSALAARREVVMFQPSVIGIHSYKDVFIAAPDVVEVTNGEPQSLDPSLAYEIPGAHVVQQVYESLIVYNRESTDEFVPLLATDWTISPDGRTYTFTIRPGVTFHNGATLNAEDVAFTLWRGMLIGGPSSPQWLINNPLIGHGDVTQLIDPNGSLIGNRGALQNRSAAELQAACQTVKNAITYNNNLGTVTFHLTQPSGEFMYTLAGPWGAVLDRDWLIAYGGWNGSCDTWQNFYDLQTADSPIAAIVNGTGPYQLDYWTRSVEVALARNDHYWRQIPMWPGGPTGNAALQRPLIKLVPDDNQRANMLLSGEADLGTFAASSAPTLTANVLLAYDGPDGRVATLQYPTGTLRMYHNVLSPMGYDAFFTYDIATDGPRNYIGSGALDGNGIPMDFFDDIHVRKAFSYAFDWTQYISDTFGGQALQRRGPFIKGILGYTDTQPTYFYSPTLAMQEFSQAWGGQVIQHGFAITLAYNTGSTIGRQPFAEILKTSLEGLTTTFHVNVISLPWDTDYQPDMNHSRLPIFVGGWYQDIPHPNNWAGPWFRTFYADRQRLPADQRAIFGAKIDMCLTLTGSMAQTCYEDIQNTAYLSATDIFLAQPTMPHFIRGEVRGYYVNNAWFGGPYYYALSKGPLPTIETVAPTTTNSINFSSTLGTSATLNMPAGSVTQTLSIVAIPDVPVPNAPGGFQLGNLTFNLQAYVSGTLVPTQTFQNPITITLHYNAQTLGLVNENDLRLLWWDGTDWVDAACGAYHRDAINNTITVPICHFSQFAIGGVVSIGLVTSGPGYSDPVQYPFDWLAYQGLLRAQRELSVTTKVYTTSIPGSNYQAKLTQCANDGNALCIGIGSDMHDPILNVAALMTSTKFAAIDVSFDVTPDNVRGGVFADDEMSYLAGVLAGKMTTNNTVGVVGGMQIPSVVRLAEGYRNGAQCANGRARVLINYTGTFVDPNLGAQTAQQMMAQGADVIFGAAGATGNGAILTAAQSGKWAIGVDSDQYVTLFMSGTVSGANKLLSSALKRVDNAVFATSADVVSGTFTFGNRLYGLTNGGVDLAPFHETDPFVSAGVRSAIDAARQGIVNGTLNVSEDCRSYVYLPLVRK